MTSSGEPQSGAGGVDGPDWIDQILERATSQVEASGSARKPLPIVPEPTSTASNAAETPRATESTEPPVVRRAPVPLDGLAEIRWVDTPDVTPASTPIVAPQSSDGARPGLPGAARPVGDAVGLTANDVGRSAWDSQLATIEDQEPAGWDKLSWQDLDGDDEGPEFVEETGFGRVLREWGPVVFAAVAIALFTRLVLVQAYHIPSESMVPTLEDGDRVVVNRLSYQFGEVERGQVVVFDKPQGSEGENDLIKRVIGLPGETIRFVDNQVYINGWRVEESAYLLEPDSTRPRLTIPNCVQVTQSSDECTIPEDHVFVMGDNRLGSLDSRVFGPIPIDSIVGRAFMRVWPLNNLGQL